MIPGPLRRDRLVGGRPAGGVATAAIAALAAGTIAVVPGYVIATGATAVSAAAIGVVAAPLVLYAAAATLLICRTRAADGGRRDLRWTLCGSLCGAVAGLSLVATMGQATVSTIGLGIACAALAAGGCAAGAYVGHRHTPTAMAGGPTRRPIHRRDIVVAGAAIAMAVLARNSGTLAAELVPDLVAVAVALGAGTLLGPVARWIGSRAVRVSETVPDGRPEVIVAGDSVGLADRPDPRVEPSPPRRVASGVIASGVVAATAYLSRRRGLDRVVALATAGIIVAGAAAFAWTSGIQARRDRAAVELGADRVLTVAPVPAGRLVEAVRAADPGGRYAMAAIVVVGGPPANSALVAVDSRRLAAVVPGGVRSGPTGAELASVLRPRRSAPTLVTGATLQLNLSAPGSVGPAARILALLSAPGGVTRRVAFGPLRTGEHVYAAAAPCPTGCTVLGFRVSGTAAPAQIALRELRQRSPDRTILDAAAFGDAARWRVDPVLGAGGLTFTASAAGLDIAVPANSGPAAAGGPVVHLNADPPLPAIVGPAATSALTIGPPGAAPVDVKVTRFASAVPGIPAAGVLVDVTEMMRAAAIDPTNADTTSVGTTSAGTTSEVWLAAGVPRSLLVTLAGHGLRVVSDTSVRKLANGYAAQPAVAIARFQLLAGIVALWCAAFLIGAVTRAHRGSRTGAKGVGLGVAAWAAGVGGALVARHAGPDIATGFTDGWARVPPPPLVGAAGFGAFAAVTAVLLGASAFAVARRARSHRGAVGPAAPIRPVGGRPDAGSWAPADGPKKVSH